MTTTIRTPTLFDVPPAEPERVVCGCGRHLPLYARRSPRDTEVLYWVAPFVFATGEPKEAVRVEDRYGQIIHRCPTRDWPRDGSARLHLVSEAA